MLILDPPSAPKGTEINNANIGEYIKDFVARAYEFIEQNPTEWKLDNNADLEVTNHVLRVYIQDGSIREKVHHVRDLCAVQHADGGWGDLRDDPESRLRSTSFCVQMLLRAGRSAVFDELEKAIRAGLAFIVRSQLDDGSWRDHRWHQLDAVSTSVGTLLFANNEPAYRSPDLAAALAKGMAYIDSRRAENGLWFYKPKSSPVTITAHLIQKTAIYHGANEQNIVSAYSLLNLQDPAGHWDHENIDHTCDATRSLMLTASLCKSPELAKLVQAAARRAVAWILAAEMPGGGLGDRPGRKPHVERTCDGLDTMLKFNTYVADMPKMSSYWH